jgi:hypothetical protein
MINNFHHFRQLKLLVHFWYILSHLPLIIYPDYAMERVRLTSRVLHLRKQRRFKKSEEKSVNVWTSQKDCDAIYFFTHTLSNLSNHAVKSLIHCQ